MVRALLCSIGTHARVPGLEVAALGNGGMSIRSVHGGVERRFRLRKATLDQYGALVVRVNTDSILTHGASNAPGFWDEPTLESSEYEQWILAYVLNPVIRTFERVTAAYPVGLYGDKSPYRLLLDRHASISLRRPEGGGGGRFRGGDDLGFDDEGEAEDGS